MNFFLNQNFIRWYWIVCAAVFLVVLLRAFFIPFSHDEASTFFFYVQTGNFLPYKAHVYTNNHVLNSALSTFCYQLAGSHRFVLRVPNVLSFLILCFAVYRFFKYLNTYTAKIVLTVFFILTFNFLDFFELCRGYGLSMSFLLLGLSYLHAYFKERQFDSLILFAVSVHLALAANLILVVILSFLFVLLYFYQLRFKLFFSAKNIVLQSFSIYILYKWVKFSFFYKSQGVLDSGAGENYWKTTFLSLMDLIYGTNAVWIQIVILSVFAGVFLFVLARIFKVSFSLTKVFEEGWYYTFALAVLVIGIYLQKQLLDVNYPEDRTGLFFYVFYALAVVFVIDVIPKLFSSVLSSVFLVSSIFHFINTLNLQSFTHYFYHVMPKEVYGYLETEYQKDKKSFTIGGNISREMVYAFHNYRGGGFINHMQTYSSMQMNCDYYFASRVDEPYYRPYYNELIADNTWNRVLLKRKTPIERKSILSLDSLPKYYGSTAEFQSFIKLNDSLLQPNMVLEAEVTLFFKSVPKPFRAFLVLSVDDSQGKTVCYERAILNWLEDDLSGKSRTLKLTTSNLPANASSAIVYLWNIEKQNIDFSLVDIKMYELQGEGIHVKVPEEYYKQIEKLTLKPIL